jgi:hypothetical protein
MWRPLQSHSCHTDRENKQTGTDSQANEPEGCGRCREHTCGGRCKVTLATQTEANKQTDRQTQAKGPEGCGRCREHTCGGLAMRLWQSHSCRARSPCPVQKREERSKKERSEKREDSEKTCVKMPSEEARVCSVDFSLGSLPFQRQTDREKQRNRKREESN